MVQLFDLEVIGNSSNHLPIVQGRDCDHSNNEHHANVSYATHSESSGVLNINVGPASHRMCRQIQVTLVITKDPTHYKQAVRASRKEG